MNRGLSSFTNNLSLSRLTAHLSSRDTKVDMLTQINNKRSDGSVNFSYMRGLDGFDVGKIAKQEWLNRQAADRAGLCTTKKLIGRYKFASLAHGF